MRKVRTMCSYKTATKTRLVLLPTILELACYFFTLPCHSSTDTLLQGQQLRDWDHLTSSNGVFSLRFFSPGSGMIRYLAVFYHYAQTEDLRDGKVVWVADRDNPIPDTSGSLAFDVHGNLLISYSGGTSAVFFNPGMKLGFHFKAGRKWSLTSWRSDISPASGSFTLVGNPNDTRQLVLQHRGNLSWTSGPLRNGSFANMRAETPVRFNYVSKEGEKYFIHSGNTSGGAAPILILTPDGYLHRKNRHTSLEVMKERSHKVKIQQIVLLTCVFAHQDGYLVLHEDLDFRNVWSRIALESDLKDGGSRS